VLVYKVIGQAAAQSDVQSWTGQPESQGVIVARSLRQDLALTFSACLASMHAQSKAQLNLP
jgi:hypothetical protein